MQALRKTYRGRGFYLFAATLCALIILVLAISIAISLTTIGRSKERTGEALDAAIMAYDLYLQEISNEPPWDEELRALNGDGFLEDLPANPNGAALAALAQRLSLFEKDSSVEDISLYIYFESADLLWGSQAGEARGYDPRLSELSLSSLPQDRKVNFMLTGNGEMFNAAYEMLFPGIAILRVTSMPELPNLSVLSPIEEVTEMYFIDRFGHSYGFSAENTLGEAFSFESLSGDGERGFVDISFEGRAYRCYYHDVSPGYNKFVLVAPDIVGLAYSEFTRAIWIAGLLLVALGCFVALVLTRRIYDPLQRIIARLTPPETDIRDEFKLIGFAFSAMEKRLKEQAGLISSFHLMRLLRGQADLGKEGADFFFHGAESVTAVAILRLDEGEGLQGLHDALLQYMKEAHRDCCAGEDGGFLFAVLDASGGGLIPLLERLSQQLAEKAGILVSIFVSEPHAGRDMLQTGYQEAMEILEQETRRGSFHTVAGYEALLQQHEHPRGEGAELFAEMLAYVKANYRDPDISTFMLADRFGLSQPSVSRLFKRYVKGGFLGCLHGLRIEKAKELLKSSRLSVAEISGAVGYSSALTMTRAFKRYTGSTPGSFR